jgi:hypothetical protein
VKRGSNLLTGDGRNRFDHFGHLGLEAMAIGIGLLMVMVVVVLAWGEQPNIFMSANIAHATTLAPRTDPRPLHCHHRR